MTRVISSQKETTPDLRPRVLSPPRRLRASLCPSRPAAPSSITQIYPLQGLWCQAFPHAMSHATTTPPLPLASPPAQPHHPDLPSELTFSLQQLAAPAELPPDLIKHLPARPFPPSPLRTSFTSPQPHKTALPATSRAKNGRINALLCPPERRSSCGEEAKSAPRGFSHG